MNETDINRVAQYVFLEHKTTDPVRLEIDGLTSPKDLFCFCFELLCKGLVLMHGQDETVDIETLTNDMIRNTCKRLEVTGIVPHIEISPYKTPDKAVSKMVASCDAKGSDKLSSYFASLYTEAYAVIIRFTLDRN